MVELFRTSYGVFHVADPLEVMQSLEDSSVSSVFVVIRGEADYGRILKDLGRVLADPCALVVYVFGQRMLQFFSMVSDIVSILDYVSTLTVYAPLRTDYVFVFGKNVHTPRLPSPVFVGFEDPLVVSGNVTFSEWCPTHPLAFIVKNVLPSGTVFIPCAYYGELCLVCERLGVRWVACEYDPSLGGVVRKIVAEGVHPNEALRELVTVTQVSGREVSYRVSTTLADYDTNGEVSGEEKERKEEEKEKKEREVKSPRKRRVTLFDV